MATVFIPPVLRAFVGNVKQVSAEGATLTDVLNDLFGRFPGRKDADPLSRRHSEHLRQRLRQ